MNDLPSVKTPCPGIRVLHDEGTLIERLGKPFSAYTIIHTGRLVILSTTGAMDHELFNELKQLRIVYRELRGHEAVNLLWSMQLSMRFEKDDNMCMRKAPFLELNCVKKARNITKYVILNVMNKGVKFGMEDMCDQIKTCGSSLTIKQSILNLWPCRIGSHGDEKVSSFKVPINGQGILAKLLYIACATRER